MSSTRRISRIAAASRWSASRNAASIAETFAATTRALSEVDSSICAIASWRAGTVRFSICDDDADSVRSKIVLIGPRAGLSGPRAEAAYLSNDARAAAASSMSVARSAGMLSRRSAIAGVIVRS